jgi:hypothetical protein
MARMYLFVVLDTKGSGRVLGVFDDRQRAEEITRRYPHYYHLRPAGLLSEVPDHPAPAGAPSGRVHVVVDTMGHYRLVGVLADRSAADRLVRKSPGYCRIVECTLNRINPDVLDWTGDAEQRAFLAALIEREPQGQD